MIMKARWKQVFVGWHGADDPRAGWATRRWYEDFFMSMIKA